MCSGVGVAFPPLSFLLASLSPLYLFFILPSPPIVPLSLPSFLHPVPLPFFIYAYAREH
jgi:hypothetical protein